MPRSWTKAQGSSPRSGTRTRGQGQGLEQDKDSRFKGKVSNKELEAKVRNKGSRLKSEVRNKDTRSRPGALRILRTHGMSATSLYDVFRATVAAKLVYCSPAWSGFCSAADINRLNAFLQRCKRYGYCPDDFPNISELFSDTDGQLFSRISHNVTLSHFYPQTLKIVIIWETDVCTTLY